MGLFDIFKKSKTIQCARCSATVNENAAKEFRGKKYCAYCHGVVSSGTGNQNQGGGYHGGNGNRGGQHTNTGSQGGYNGGGQNFGGSGYSNGSTGYTGGSEHPSIQDIRKAFDAVKINYHVNHIGNQWELVAGVNGKANTYQVKFICKDDGKCDVAVRIFGLAHYPDHRRNVALPILNEFQRKYRFIKLNLDKSGDVNLEYDLPACQSNVGASCVELFLRIMKIVDEIYPDLMRSVWN